MRCLVAILFIIITHVFSAFAFSENLKMLVGDIKVIKIQDIERVAVANDKVVQYKPLENNELLFIASKPGATTVHIWQKGNRQKQYKILVASDRDVKSNLGFARLLSDVFTDVDVTLNNKKLIFTGSINKGEVKKLDTIVKQFKNSINLVDVRSFKVEPIIHLNVKLVELSRRATSKIGLQWSDSLAGPVFGLHKTFAANGNFQLANPSVTEQAILQTVSGGDRSFYGYAGVTSSLFSRINLMALTGEAKIIASPKLTTKSGKPARFRSGGQIPITVTDEFGRSEISFKDYGLTLNINPIIDENGNIETAVFTEVSALDPAVNIRGIPGITTRSTKTTVNLKDGDTLAISGLGYVTESYGKNKVPLLGDLPYIGRLFSSRSKSSNATELVVLITPKTIDPSSKINKQMIDYVERKNILDENETIESFLME